MTLRGSESAGNNWAGCTTKHHASVSLGVDMGDKDPPNRPETPRRIETPTLSIPHEQSTFNQVLCPVRLISPVTNAKCKPLMTRSIGVKETSYHLEALDLRGQRDRQLVACRSSPQLGKVSSVKRSVTCG